MKLIYFNFLWGLILSSSFKLLFSIDNIDKDEHIYDLIGKFNSKFSEHGIDGVDKAMDSVQKESNHFLEHYFFDNKKRMSGNGKAKEHFEDDVEDIHKMITDVYDYHNSAQNSGDEKTRQLNKPKEISEDYKRNNADVDTLIERTHRYHDGLTGQVKETHHTLEVSLEFQTDTPTAAPTFSANAAYCVKTGGEAVVPSHSKICQATANINVAFNELIYGEYSNENVMNQSNLFGQTLRVVYQDAAEANITDEYDFLGPDGCLSNRSSNDGLVESTSLIMSVLEPIWQENCELISRADFWVYFAYLSIDHAERTNLISSGALEFPYIYGRKDATGCSYEGPDRIPDPQLGEEGNYDFFVNMMGLTVAQGGKIYFLQNDIFCQYMNVS